MPNETIKNHWQWVTLWLLVIFAALYSRPPIPIDETRYLSVAWEMWQSHNFLVPHINGEPYSHKPPLLFWITDLFWFVFGVSEWVGRLIGPLFGLGSAALTVKLANILWPDRREVGKTVPFILLGLTIWTLFGSLTMFDTLLTFFSLLGLISILKAAQNTSKWWWIGLSFSIGFGILAKGPVVLLFIVPPVLLAPVWVSQKNLSWKRWYATALLSLLGGVLLAGCWAIPAAMAGGKEYEQAILFSQTAGRMVKSFAHNRPFYWYLMLIPLFGLPWFFYVPAWKGWKNTVAESSMRFCLVALLIPLILLSFVSGKQIHYLMPILPVSALLFARIITASPRTTKLDALPLLIIFLVLTIALVVIPKLPLHGGDRAFIKNIPQWIALIPLVNFGLLLVTRSNRTTTMVKAVALNMLLLMVCLHLAISDPLHSMFDQSEIGEAVQKAQSRGSSVAVYPAHLADQFQFAGRLTTPVIPQNSIHEIAVWAKKHQNAFCLIFTNDSQIEDMLGTKIVHRYKGGWLLLRSSANLYPDYVKLVQARADS